MSASAGVAAAADKGLAATAGGQDAGAQAAIVIVCRDPGARETLHRELSRRYGADYQILACGRPGELAAWMRDLQMAGLPVALVIGGVGGPDRDGIEVLSAIRAIDPTALRVAAVHWGDWESRRSVFDAVTVGTVDRWVWRPVQVPDEEFHRSVTEFLREWASQRGGGFEPVQVIGERWSGRSQELRDLFARHRLPAGFYDAAAGPARQRLGIPALEDLQGRGVFYGAAASEAPAMRGRTVFVPGGGNSAGQTALHLAKWAGRVTILVRGPSLAATMSDYLIRQITHPRRSTSATAYRWPAAPAPATSNRWSWPTPPPGRGAMSQPTPCSS